MPISCGVIPTLTQQKLIHNAHASSTPPTPSLVSFTFHGIIGPNLSKFLFYFTKNIKKRQNYTLIQLWLPHSSVSMLNWDRIWNDKSKTLLFLDIFKWINTFVLLVVCHSKQSGPFFQGRTDFRDESDALSIPQWRIIIFQQLILKKTKQN